LRISERLHSIKGISGETDCPMIVSRCGGAEMQIRDGENGLLVAPNDPISLRQAIESIINEPRSLQTYG
jgi:glycosyltransferase involved in cell wall biosynthesis